MSFAELAREAAREVVAQLASGTLRITPRPMSGARLGVNAGGSPQPMATARAVRKPSESYMVGSTGRAAVRSTAFRVLREDLPGDLTPMVGMLAEFQADHSDGVSSGANQAAPWQAMGRVQQVTEDAGGHAVQVVCAIDEGGLQ